MMDSALASCASAAQPCVRVEYGRVQRTGNVYLCCVDAPRQRFRARVAELFQIQTAGG